MPLQWKVAYCPRKGTELDVQSYILAPVLQQNTHNGFG